MQVVHMAAHIERLLQEHNIRQEERKTAGGLAYRHLRLIKIKPVRSPVTYAVALHEIGHILGPMQGRPRLYSEAGAWVWARLNALVWTESMTLEMSRGLQVHLWQYNGRKEWWTRDISNCPPKDHVFWTLIQAVGQLPMADRVKQKKTSATVLFESLFEEGVI